MDIPLNKQYNQDQVDGETHGLLVLGLVEHVGEATLAAVLTIKVSSHEDSGSTLLSWTLASQTVDLAVIINLVKM